jgi:hypothetical protein
VVENKLEKSGSNKIKSRIVVTRGLEERGGGREKCGKVSQRI